MHRDLDYMNVQWTSALGEISIFLNVFVDQGGLGPAIRDRGLGS